MYKINYYVPASHLESTKAAVFAAGAGKIGNYQHCAFVTKGLGQFMPIAGANPVVGELDKLEQLEEYKVELVCAEAYLPAVIDALKHSHPYEEVAFDVIRILPIS